MGKRRGERDGREFIVVKSLNLESGFWMMTLMVMKRGI